MAPFDWMTRDRVIVSLWMVLGIAWLYRGFTTPVPEPILGVDARVWIGIGFFVAGILFWYELRPKQDEANSD